MSQKKRHLSIQQQRNINKHRQNLISKKSAKHQAQTQAIEDYLEQQENLTIKKGIVISRYGKSADVMPLSENKFTDQVQRCFMKASLDDLVVGDYVFYYDINDEQSFIVEKEERKNLITRFYFNKERNIVANVDTMLITSSINPTLNTEIIDRYLIVAENSQVKPLILINKIDLIESEEERQEVDNIISYYQSLGYDALPVSVAQDFNIDLVKNELNQGLHILVGQTGVGKSSLINAIFGKELMSVGEINYDTKLGKHTTTTSRLFKINDFSALIDSPGIREFSLENYNEKQLLKGYKELHDPNYACRFSDCNHVNNAGCGIQRLHQDGKISEFRYTNLMNLLQQVNKD
ncbi:ribosome small subunit-dependent GTPase A [Psittacicella melopsittaci]|uniref:Small ribosomal subunit biogenesis GTPase RsgA n=1 Tax=Psittacicella melopsittaci TaxID=2028576 RepID=A0A3A1Y2P8_9GAMM|nr:ribosome small subunit-dependent GTPase A [Psittacicella melopsittaci]RIY32503.1 ribosome small subunit-dependent GTPase A [Psittacicella melopsittaci]